MRSLPLILLFVFPVHASLSGNGLWQQEVRQLRSQDQSTGEFYRADQAELAQILNQAGDESRPSQAASIELPTIEGEIQRFKVLQTTVMEPELAARYPQIKSYRIRGVDDPSATGRITMTGKGFSAMVVSQQGTLYLDPVDTNRHRAYSKRSQSVPTEFKCGVEGHNHDHPAGINLASRNVQARIPGSLRVYRLALATASEYVSAVDDGNALNGDAKSDTIAELATTVSRVNETYERDLGIRLVLVGNNSDVIFDVAADADPYSNPDVSSMLSENQTTLDSLIGTANYDIGHVFGTGGGGIATVGSVCEGGYKAQGATGLVGAPGDAFYIDYVAHEIGHQFGASHSFNGTTLNCGGANRSATTAYEPGSGSTIMAYAGICSGENIQGNSDDHFHAGSIAQIDSFTASSAGSCNTTDLASNPNEPTVMADSNSFTIPRETPFLLTASANDDDGDTLTYNWYQMDTGAATTSLTLGQDLGSNPLFRSYLPRSENYRHFPALATTLTNQFDDAEVLPCISRTLNFKVVVRDGNSGVGYDDIAVTVDNGSGPFKVSNLDSTQTIAPGNVQVTWDVANTDQAPVNCASVDISLLTFNSGKTSYAESVLLAADANDGSATITIPDISAGPARIKVQCSNQFFYDINDADLTISGTVAAATTGKTVFNNSANGTLSSTPATTCTTGTTAVDTGGGGSLGSFGGDSGDSGGVSSLLLGLLYPLWYLRRRRVT